MKRNTLITIVSTAIIMLLLVLPTTVLADNGKKSTAPAKKVQVQPTGNTVTNTAKAVKASTSKPITTSKPTQPLKFSSTVVSKSKTAAATAPSKQVKSTSVTTSAKSTGTSKTSTSSQASTSKPITTSKPTQPLKFSSTVVSKSKTAAATAPSKQVKSAPTTSPTKTTQYNGQEDLLKVGKGVITEAITSVAKIPGIASPAISKVVAPVEPLGILGDYAEAAKKEGITLKDMGNAYLEAPETLKWAKDHKGEALNGLGEGLAKVGAISINTVLEATEIAPVTRLITNGKIDPKITSNQIINVGKKIGETDFESLLK